MFALNNSVITGGSGNDNGRSEFEVVNQFTKKKTFSTVQLFAFSLTYMAIWESMAGNLYFALYNGGPQCLVFGFIIVYSGAILQAASICEMASMAPINAAQYIWTYCLAPKTCRAFAAYVQGWSTWFGYMSIVAGMANVTMIFLQSIVKLNYPDLPTGGWITSVLVILMFVIVGALNIFGFVLIPWIEMVSGVLHVAMFVVFNVVLLVSGTRNSGDFWLYTTSSSGWPVGSISWNLGMLTSVWGFTGFEGGMHMSEDTHGAKSAVPKAIFGSIVLNGILAFCTINVLVLAMGPPEEVLAMDNPIIAILMRTTGSKTATTALMLGFSIINLSCNIANVASVSRLSSAWARDGGLPRYFSRVDEKWNVPIRAVCLTVAVPSLLCLLNLANDTYIAFGALTSISSISLYISYAIAIASMLYARRSGNAELGEWNLGQYGVYINIFALMYTLYIIALLPFPSTLPVTASNMNYSGPLMSVVLLAVTSYWYTRASNKRWKPDEELIHRVMKSNS